MKGVFGHHELIYYILYTSEVTIFYFYVAAERTKPQQVYVSHTAHLVNKDQSQNSSD